MTKEEAIQQYINWIITQPSFKEKVKRQVFYYLDCGVFPKCPPS